MNTNFQPQISPLLSSTPLPAGERFILSRSNGLDFRNSVIAISVHDGKIILTTTEQKNDFREMDQNRRNPNNILTINDDLLPAVCKNLSLSNIGVSLAITTEIDGQDYLVLVKRGTGSNVKLMLPSGYVDDTRFDAGMSTGEKLAATALKELAEEVLAVHIDPVNFSHTSCTFQIQAAESNKLWKDIAAATDRSLTERDGQVIIGLGAAYAQEEDCFDLNFSDEKSLTLRPSNDVSFLPSLSFDQTVVIDNQEITHGVFYYLRETQSGQFVYPFRLELGDLTGLSLQHAETMPDKEGGPGDLLEVLDREGLALARIDPKTGLLSGETFSLTDGRLIPTGVSSDDLLLSEVFGVEVLPLAAESLLLVTTPTVSDGKAVTTAPFSEYLERAEEHRESLEQLAMSFHKKQ